MKPQTDELLHDLTLQLYSAAEFLRDHTHIDVDIIDEKRYLDQLLSFAELAGHRAYLLERHIINMRRAVAV